MKLSNAEPVWVKILLFSPLLAGLILGWLVSEETLGFLNLIKFIVVGGLFTLSTAIIALSVKFIFRKSENTLPLIFGVAVPSLSFTAILIYMALDL